MPGRHRLGKLSSGSCHRTSTRPAYSRTKIASSLNQYSIHAFYVASPCHPITATCHVTHVVSPKVPREHVGGGGAGRAGSGGARSHREHLLFARHVAVGAEKDRAAALVLVQQAAVLEVRHQLVLALQGG